MKVYTLNCSLFVAALLLSSLTSCKNKSRSPDSLPTTPRQDGVPPARTPPNAASLVSGIDRISKRLSPSFQFKEILGLVGTKVSSEMMKTIEKDSQFLPELHDAVHKGWKIYTLGVQDDGGLNLLISDGYLIAFGYALNAPASESLDDTARFMMDEFNYSGDSLVEVVDANFDGVPMQVKNYVHKTNGTIRALAYSQNGISRSHEFYDSTKVDASKLLPASPAALGKDNIEKMKAMLRKPKPK